MAADHPIVSVSIVTDVTKCPGNHTVIERTYNGSEEADLWKDGLFGRRVTRYLCVEKAVPVENQEILVDVTIINEKDPVPPGFTVIDYTQDTREKALKKRLLCFRWMNPTLTNDAITELILMSKGTKKPPTGYTFIGELNHISICFKMSKLIKPQPTNTGNLPYQMGQKPGQGGGTINMTPLGSSLPYAMNASDQAAMNGHLSRSGHADTLQRQASISNVNALTGVPWQLNSKYKNENVVIPEIRYKSLMDVERQYQYDFRVEQAAVQAARGES